MPRTRTRRIALGCLVAVLALSACGGGSSNKSKSSGGSGTSGDDFASLVAQQAKAKIRVTYQSGTDDPFTISQDGNGNVAYITKDSVVITKDGTTTSCSGLPDNVECTSLSGDAAKAATLGYTAILSAATGYINAAHAANGFGKESSETIAGRDARCVTITIGSALGKLGGAIAGAAGAKTDAGYKACVDKSTGILLSWEIVGDTSGDSQKIVATAVGEPQDSDFVPPTTTTTPGDTTGDTTGDTSGDTSTTSGGETSTTVCAAPITLPAGITLPNGVTLPCP